MSAAIYLAARFSRRHEMQGIRGDILRNQVGLVTSRWIDNCTDDEADALKCAKIDIEDLDAADVVIAFADEPRSNRSRGGHHVEFGYGLAQGKRIILIAHRENVFNYLPEVEFFPTWESCLATLKAEQDKPRLRLVA
jgi:nucleoside 2-deoxyribosyltransferase